MNALDRHNADVSVIIPREKVLSACFVNTSKEMFLNLMEGNRVCFKQMNDAAKVYLKAVAIFKTLYHDGMSDLEYVTKLNDYIVINVRYDHYALKSDAAAAAHWYSWEIEGPLFHKVGVCEAKTKFFSMMCALANIKTAYVLGRVKNSNSSSRHIWNKVEIKSPDGTQKRWYNIDVTANTTHGGDNAGYIFNDVFLLSDEQVAERYLTFEYPDWSEYNITNYLSVHSYGAPRS